MVIDKSNYILALESFPKQIRESLNLTKGMTVNGEFSNIIVCGMGGSSIGGDILAAYLKNNKIPVYIIRDYTLPEFVDNTSLVFAISYSGNTEETLSVYDQAIKKGCAVIAITSGGRLGDICQKKITIPSGYQPRAAIGYLFFPMLGVLHNAGIVNIKNDELNEMLNSIKDVESYKNQAEEISKRLRDKVPLIYSSNLMYPVAYRFKTQINENSKYPAFCHAFPEMNHNEILGFNGMDRKRFVAVLIRDSHDHPRIIKRMDICKGIFEDKIDVIEISAKGKSLLTRIFSTILLNDFISYFLALYYRVDPCPVEVIERLKSALK